MIFQILTGNNNFHSFSWTIYILQHRWWICCISSISRLTTFSGTIASWYLVLLIPLIFWKWNSQISLGLSPMTSSLIVNLCKYNFSAAVTGVIFSPISNISTTFETHCLLLNFSNTPQFGASGFLTRLFFEMFYSFAVNETSSPFEYWFNPPTIVLFLSSDSDSGGLSSQYVIILR